MSTKISLSEATQVTETTGEFSMEDGLFVIRIPIETYVSESKKSMILCSFYCLYCSIISMFLKCKLPMLNWFNSLPYYFYIVSRS